MGLLDPALRLGLRGLLAMPDRVVRRVVPSAPVIRGRSPDLRLWWLCRIVDAGSNRLSPRSARAEYDASSPVLGGRVPPGVVTTDGTLSARSGGLRTRTYRPPSASGAGVVFFHGGGWTIGSLLSHDGVCGRLAVDTGATVVSVEYRLAPEHPFPAAWEDVEDAWASIVEHLDGYGIGSTPAVAGDSAGGNLAVFVARTAAVKPCHAFLLYPSVDPGGSWQSKDDFGQSLFLTADRIHWFHEQVYVEPGDTADPRAAPLKADVSGMPPTTIVIAGLDPLCDEDEAFAEHLKQSGVQVNVVELPGQVHGFVNLLGAIESCRAAWDEAVLAFSEALGR